MRSYFVAGCAFLSMQVPSSRELAGSPVPPLRLPSLPPDCPAVPSHRDCWKDPHCSGCAYFSWGSLRPFANATPGERKEQVKIMNLAFFSVIARIFKPLLLPVLVGAVVTVPIVAVATAGNSGHASLSAVTSSESDDTPTATSTLTGTQTVTATASPNSYLHCHRHGHRHTGYDKHRGG